MLVAKGLSHFLCGASEKGFRFLSGGQVTSEGVFSRDGADFVVALDRSRIFSMGQVPQVPAGRFSQMAHQ